MARPSDKKIRDRRTAYGCCLANYQALEDKANALGELKKAKRYNEIWWTLYWAWNIMNQAAIGSETGGEMCISDELLCCAINKADPLCVKACAPATTSTSCDPVINWTVLGVLAQEDLPGGATTGDAYLVDMVGVYPTGYIATWDGAIWQNTVPAAGEVIFDQGASEFWTIYGGYAGPLFPIPNIYFGGTLGTYIVNTPYPWISNNAGRQIKIEALNGSTATQVFLGNESDLFLGLVINVIPFGITTADDFQITYIQGSCEYPFPANTFLTPPFSSIFFGRTAQDFSSVDVYHGMIEDPQPWTIVDTPTPGALNRVNALERNDAGAMVWLGYGGAFRTSADGLTWGTPGGNWASSPYLSGPAADLAFSAASFALEDQTCCWAVTSGGGLFRSTDSGATFDYIDQTSFNGQGYPSQSFQSVGAYSSQECVVGAGGIVWRTTDGGATWTQVLFGFNANFMLAIGDRVMVFTDTGLMSVSDDRGVTWAPNLSYQALGISSPLCLDKWGNTVNTALIRTGHGAYSDDGGTTWNVYAYPGVAGFVGISMISPKVVLYAGPTIGADKGLYLSIDGGATANLFYKQATNDPSFTFTAVKGVFL